MTIKFRSSAIFIGLLLTVITSQTHNQSSRGQAVKRMLVSLPKLSPAQAAYEDANYSFQVAEKSEYGKRTVLSSGSSSDEWLEAFKQAANAPAPSPVVWLTTVGLGGRLPGFVKKQEPRAIVALQGITLKHRELPDIQPMLRVQKLIAKNSLRQNLVEELQAQDWSQPSSSQRAEALVKKELARVRDDNTRHLPNGVFVAGNNFTTAPTSHSANSSEVEYSSKSSVKVPTLYGQVRLVGGVAVLGTNDRIVVYREVDGDVRERGIVSMAEGRFEITPQDWRGQLVAELHSANKGIVGRGLVTLAQLKYQREKINIEISPAVSGAVVSVISARSFGSHVELVKKSLVEALAEKAQFNSDSTGRWHYEEGFQNESSYLAQVSAVNHWGSILIGVAGEETRAKLFPNPMVEAFLQLTLGNDRHLARQSGIIWGVVTRNGLPVKGAKVEMAGDHRNAGIYFNQLMMPDKFLDQSGENGAFAFAWVTPGIQVVRVSYEGQTYPAHVIPVEQGQVSYLEFEVGGADSVPLEIFDPFDPNKELNAIVRIVGNEDKPIEVQGSRRLPLNRGNGMMMIEIDAGDMYELVRLSVPRNIKTLRVPIVRRDWALGVAVRRRINLGANVGMAIGFVDDSSFVVRVSERAEGEKEEIIYFDRDGRPVYGDEGPQGGGFVIYNLSPGMRTISVVKNSSLKLKSNVVVSDPLYTNIVLP